MSFARSSGAAPRTPVPAKIVVAGGPGVGKTTFVGTVSEIRPLRTEAVLTSASAGIDEPAHAPGRTTTVAMDFGRLTLDDGRPLCLFGLPGQDRFRFIRGNLMRGAVGAVVLADSRRPADCFPAVRCIEDSGLPFVVGLNGFDGHQPCTPDEAREALRIGPRTPVLTIDARLRRDAENALVALMVHDVPPWMA